MKKKEKEKELKCGSLPTADIVGAVGIKAISENSHDMVADFPANFLKAPDFLGDMHFDPMLSKFWIPGRLPGRRII